jgi:hypothetical protein
LGDTQSAVHRVIVCPGLDRADARAAVLAALPLTRSSPVPPSTVSSPVAPTNVSPFVPQNQCHGSINFFAKKLDGIQPESVCVEIYVVALPRK